MSIPPAKSAEDIVLKCYGLRLTSSTYGASLRGLSQLNSDGSGSEIITNYKDTESKVGGQGDVLIPFPGRIKQGRYWFEGQQHELECNDKEGPNAIHGFVRTMIWNVVERDADHVRYSVDLGSEVHAGYPFSIRISIDYTLSASGFSCSYMICNTGSGAAPVAAGFHPYFTLGTGQIDDWTLELPFRSMLEFEDLVPTGAVTSVEGTPFDFRTRRRIGSTKFNSCFVDPVSDQKGFTTIRLGRDDGKSLKVWINRDLQYVVVYSGDPLPPSHRRRSIAIEPMSCGSDGFNHPEWGLVALAPGASCSGEWGVSLEV